MKTVIFFLFITALSAHGRTKTLPSITGKLHNHTEFANNEIKIEVRLKCIEGLWARPCGFNNYGSGFAKINEDGTFTIPKIKLNVERNFIQKFVKTCIISTPTSTRSDICSQSTNRNTYKDEFKNLSIFNIPDTKTNFILSTEQTLEDFLANNDRYHSFYYNLSVEAENGNVYEVFKHELQSLKQSVEDIKFDLLVYNERMNKNTNFNFNMEIGLDSFLHNPILYSNEFSTTLSVGSNLSNLSTAIIPIENFYQDINGQWEIYLSLNGDAIEEEFNVDRFEFGFDIPGWVSRFDVTCEDGIINGDFFDINSNYDRTQVRARYKLKGTCNESSATIIIQNYVFESYKPNEQRTYSSSIKFEIDYIDSAKFEAKGYSLETGRMLFKSVIGTNASKI